MIKKSINEYLITVIVTLIVALASVGWCVFSLEKAAHEHYLSSPEAREKVDERKIIIGLIAKYERRARHNATNYANFSKLGNLYDLLGETAEAEKNYKKAVALSTYGIFGTFFDLGNFYIRQDKLIKAENVVNQVRNKRNKAVQSAKGDFYINLGDAYYDEGDYNTALKGYQKAYELYKFANKSDKLRIATARIFDAYDAIANEHLKGKRLVGAIQELEESLKYSEEPFITYKLAILYMDVDPALAYKYIRKTYESDPAIINFDIYEKILVDAYRYYENAGMAPEASLFKHKLKLAKKFREKYLIMPDDFGIEIVSARIKKHLFGDKKTAIVKFKIKNNTAHNVNLMYIDVNAETNNDKSVVYKNALFTRKKPLAAKSDSKPIEIKYSFNDIPNIDYTNDVKFSFNITKKKNVRTVNIYSFKIEK